MIEALENAFKFGKGELTVVARTDDEKEDTNSTLNYIIEFLINYYYIFIIGFALIFIIIYIVRKKDNIYS